MGIEENIIIGTSGTIAFVITFFLIPKFIDFFERIKITSIDQQKKNKPWLATSGGVPVVVGFIFGLLVFTFLTVFTGHGYSIHIFAAALSIILIASVGLFDDLNLRVSNKEPAKFGKEVDRLGLRRWMKIVLPILFSLPVFFSLNVFYNFPFIYFAIFPLAVTFAANATNILAGFNGIHSGPIMIASTALSLYLVHLGRYDAAAISFVGAFALLAYLIFEWPPAKILPGDSLTYFTGSTFAISAIIGRSEFFALILFIPWILDFIIKIPYMKSVRTYGDLQPDGTIQRPYKYIASFAHVPMWLSEKINKRKMYEWEVPASLMFIELSLIFVALIVTYFFNPVF